MRRTSIKPKRLHQLAQEYLSERPIAPPNPKGGRPRTYDDALILTIACIQNLNSYSFREALEYCEDHFKELPALSSYHERLGKFTADITQGFIEYIGKKIRTSAKDAPNGGRIFVMDGTGFSYHDVYLMKLFNGMEVRKIRTHVKIGALMGLAGKKRYIVSARAGPAYAGDTTLIQPQLEALPKGKGYVLGDKGFDSIRVMTTIAAKGYHPVIPIKQGRRLKRVKEPLRIQSDKNASKKIYTKRPLVEGLFGNVKQKLSSHVRIFKLEIAKTFALLRFALLNTSVLVGIENAVALWLRFPNSATRNPNGNLKSSLAIQQAPPLKPSALRPELSVEGFLARPSLRSGLLPIRREPGGFPSDPPFVRFPVANPL